MLNTLPTLDQYHLDNYDDTEDALARLKASPLVVKISGKVVGESEILDNVLSQLVFLARNGVQSVLIHGAGPQLSSRLGEKILDSRGERVTPPNKIIDVRGVAATITLEILKRLAAMNQTEKLLEAASTIGPLGFRGKIRDKDANVSGDILNIDDYVTDKLTSLAQRDDVFRRLLVMGHVGQEDGALTNINADNVAGKMATEIGAAKLLILGSSNGILDPNGDTVGEVTPDGVEALIDSGVITEGMIPKARMAEEVAKNGTSVHIMPQSKDYGDLILRELLNKAGCPKRSTLLTHFESTSL